MTDFIGNATKAFGTTRSIFGFLDLIRFPSLHFLNLASLITTSSEKMPSTSMADSGNSSSSSDDTLQCFDASVASDSLSTALHGTVNVDTSGRDDLGTLG